ncbi:nitroalkane oxidase [Arthrobacter subterraneus]|uniref:Propionate 3-nitronate monooxygenase n=1 Tax=Arthrobacter subterraneus TaxID=335973 RepID=A0A1G8H8D8_9MICC|nr:nitronate monooxygenase [Arthrobacter subterraneus]SDI02829.1 nitroalkane oxidase [Arthrobacter subterraneus]
MFDFRDLDRPIIGAPMAGGPSTPELAAAVTNAGGLGFLAAGYRTPEDLAAQLSAVSALTGGPIGVNLFVPDAFQPDPALLDAYVASLRPETEALGVEVGQPRYDDDGWDAKLSLVLDARPAAVSFTFGCPDSQVLKRMADAGILPIVTVTTSAEAEFAVAAGARALAVQGPGAGGHRGTLDQRSVPTDDRLEDTLAAVRSVTAVPLAAGGGVSGPSDVVRLRGAGADAVQVGTALLLADEAGTNPLHRAVLAGGQFAGTSLTRAYTGRYARGLTNRFILEHSDAPAGYPHLHYATAPLRKAAVAQGNADVAHLWAGTGFASARPEPAAKIVEALA